MELLLDPWVQRGYCLSVIVANHGSRDGYGSHTQAISLGMVKVPLLLGRESTGYGYNSSPLIEPWLLSLVGCQLLSLDFMWRNRPDALSGVQCLVRV